jgi:hypothetical protein
MQFVIHGESESAVCVRTGVINIKIQLKALTAEKVIAQR